MADLTPTGSLTAAEAAKNLLEFYAGDATRWTQGEDARNAFGNPVPFGHPDACCWCLSGAIRALWLSGLDAGRWFCFADRFAGDFISWNDAPGRTFAEVVAALEKVASG